MHVGTETRTTEKTHHVERTIVFTRLLLDHISIVIKDAAERHARNLQEAAEKTPKYRKTLMLQARIAEETSVLGDMIRRFALRLENAGYLAKQGKVSWSDVGELLEAAVATASLAYWYVQTKPFTIESEWSANMYGGVWKTAKMLEEEYKKRIHEKPALANHYKALVEILARIK